MRTQIGGEVKHSLFSLFYNWTLYFVQFG